MIPASWKSLKATRWQCRSQSVVKGALGSVQAERAICHIQRRSATLPGVAKRAGRAGSRGSSASRGAHVVRAQQTASEGTAASAGSVVVLGTLRGQTMPPFPADD